MEYKVGEKYELMKDLPLGKKTRHNHYNKSVQLYNINMC